MQSDQKTELILYTRTSFQLGLDDVILFESNEQRDEYFRLGNANAQVLYRASNYSYVEDRGYLSVAKRKGEILQANYMRFKNEDEDIMYYCFILDLIYENEETTYIVFEVDVAMTYLTKLLNGTTTESGATIGGYVEQATQKRKINGAYNIVDTKQGFNVGGRIFAATEEFNNDLLWLVVVSKPSIQVNSQDTGTNSPGFPATFKNFRYFIVPCKLNAYATITTIYNGDQYNSVSVADLMKKITNTFSGSGTNTVNQTVNVYTTRHCGIDYTYNKDADIVTINEQFGITPRGLGGTSFISDSSILTDVGVGAKDADVNWTTDLTYNGVTLNASMVRRVVALCRQHKVLPVGAICQMWVESLWGTSNVAVNNNNWSGITWTGSTTSPSGVTVEQGTARPEGGYYRKYASPEDWASDFLYILRSGGYYVVSGKTVFADYVRGLFTVGGAKANYAASGYTHYNGLMSSAYNGIIASNTQAVINSINALVFSGGNWYTNSTTQNNPGIAKLTNLVGDVVGDMTDYAVVAEYSGINNGAYLGHGTIYNADPLPGADTENRSKIAESYDWGAVNFTVTDYPDMSELQAGDIICVEENNPDWGSGELGACYVITGKQDEAISVYTQTEINGYVFTDQFIVPDTGIVSKITPPPVAPDGDDIEDNNQNNDAIIIG